jgi:hypothetical protein
LLAVVDPVSAGVVAGLGRFIVGRSGSSAGVLPVWDAVVVDESPPDVVLSGLRRFMVGRSGSSAGVDPPLVVEPVSGVCPKGVPDVVVVSELRRFIVGRSESSLVEVLVVPDAVVSGLFVVEAGLLWSVPAVVSVLGFEPKCGRFGSGAVAMTGRLFDGFRAAVFRGAARGLTLP